MQYLTYEDVIRRAGLSYDTIAKRAQRLRLPKRHTTTGKRGGRMRLFTPEEAQCIEEIGPQNSPEDDECFTCPLQCIGGKDFVSALGVEVCRACFEFERAQDWQEAAALERVIRRNKGHGKEKT